MKVKIMHRMTDARIYPAAVQYLPLCTRSTDWDEKVEKVVKLPQMPTVRKSRRLPGLQIPRKKPIAQEPKILTIRVVSWFDQPIAAPARVAPYLRMAPKNPPRPTERMSLNIN